jgi:hypothetical protein
MEKLDRSSSSLNMNYSVFNWNLKGNAAFRSSLQIVEDSIELFAGRGEVFAGPVEELHAADKRQSSCCSRDCPIGQLPRRNYTHLSQSEADTDTQKEFKIKAKFCFEKPILKRDRLQGMQLTIAKTFATPMPNFR